MEQLLLPYGLPIEPATGIRMIDNNTKLMVHSPYRDTDYFDFVTGVLQRDYISVIICQEYVLQMAIDLIKVNDLTL